MNELVRTENPFGDAIAARPSATGQTDQQRAIAEVQAAMVIARANPRDERQAMDRILNACQRQTLAEVAIYSYARGGSDISGPSIRLAEALAQNWGNIQFGIRELDQTGGKSVVQAFAWDVETNVRLEMTFEVPHVRHTRQGARKLEDPRDIYETVANNGARRLRACILSIVPGDVVEAAVTQCEATMHARADTSAEAVQKLVAAFGQYDVTKAQIEARIQRRVDAIQPAQIVSLRKIYASLRDGMSTPVDWFEVDVIEATAEKQAGNAGLKAALKKRAITEAHDPETGEIQRSPESGVEAPAANGAGQPPANGAGSGAASAARGNGNGWQARAQRYQDEVREADSIEALADVQEAHRQTLGHMESQNNKLWKACRDATARRLEELQADDTGAGDDRAPLFEGADE